MRLVVLACLTFVLSAENWPGFRGAGARGLSQSANLPVSWNVETGANIAWKTAIPGLGLSSPVVWDNLVFVTTAVSSNPQMVFESRLKG
jgi:outer membrane protein assembly factor BamB